MRKLKLLLILILISIQSCYLHRRCEPVITSEYIDFDGCFNGVSIYEVYCGEVDFNPYRCERIFEVAALVIRDTSKKGDFDIGRIYFSKGVKGNWDWSCYDESGYGGVKSSSLCYNFKRETWYEFGFNFQSFTMFVYVDENGEFTQFRHNKI